MPRGGKRSGQARAGRPGSRVPKESGIEKYGQDGADEILQLDKPVDLGTGRRASAIYGGPKQLFKLESYRGEEDDNDDDDDRPQTKKQKEVDGDEEGRDELAEKRLGPMSKGWRGGEFYGGDDAGDKSGAESDEDMMLEEAARFEELRARRLKGEDDPLVALLGHASQEKKQEAAEQVVDAAGEEAATPGAGVNAQFDQLFAAAAEHGAVQRDFEKLPEEKRRGLLKSEAPELVPLLKDFRSNLHALRGVLPLLTPDAYPHMESTLKQYLEAKGSLLLNMLTNLSFYLLLRAEGGSVRSHPVVAQLVWLRELQQQLLPIDEKLAPGLSSFLQQWERLKQSTNNGEEDLAKFQPVVTRVAKTAVEQLVKPRKHVTLRERFNLLQAAKAEEAATREAREGVKQQPDVARKMSTAALLRLPRRAKKQGGVTDAPVDLDEADPLLSAWRPIVSLAEQLRPEQGREGSKDINAETNPEARPWRARPRAREGIDPSVAQEGSLEDEEDPVKVAEAKKLAREQAKLAASQFKPEEVLEGRRATSKQILVNRGLVRARKAKTGHARLTHRRKYEKAIKRRRGAVQEMRFGATDGTYEGEPTGVRTHLRKSARLG